MKEKKSFKRLLVANRSEIAIRVFRSAHELHLRTVAIYAHQDRFALHRFKADEAYQVGDEAEPVKAYLDFESIVALAKEKKIDAIHPGYGFLSENPDFARACEREGITFVGPRPELLELLGDKTAARAIAKQAGVPVLEGSAHAITDLEEARELARACGFPVMIKAAHGGGGRGMRIVETEADLEKRLGEAKREALSAFGSGDIFVEKYIPRARHIEVQILGDQHGNVVHLYERDCSVQRRHQKVVEMAPALNLAPETRQAICDAAVAIGKETKFDNAGTVEFLVDKDTEEFYFIEVNPRIQVEHTVTEEVVGHDIVKRQILIAQGAALGDEEVGLGDQSAIKVRGYAMQCRVTTEDPENNFIPDYGRVLHYRSASGMGIRLDAGTAFSSAVVTPYYDSLLVKVTARGSRFADTVSRMTRCLQEFRIRGVKTNIPFLINLIEHPAFRAGDCHTRFIDETPELFHFPRRRDRATRLMRYIGDVVVNGNDLVKKRPETIVRRPAPVPPYEANTPLPKGTRDRLLEVGPEKFAAWVREQQPVLLTDTTFRDAHQSLLATRMRTYDLLQVAPAYAHNHADLFSIEMWGGATFDSAMRFLQEDPWERLARLREKIPNILFQMLLRASNAVGYTSYPDNVVRAFVKQAADSGIDVFRIFDSLNWMTNMRVAVDAVLETGAICEAAICYTGDILDPKRDKYDLTYYVRLAKELESMGAHILAIKDMAGLCKPYAAYKLVSTLKQEVGLPIHFHTHDTSGGQVGALIKAAEAGVDIVDGAMGPLSGLTSQPNLNTAVEMLRYTDRDPGMNAESLDRTAQFWSTTRQYYTPFETELKAGTADVYKHEMPGGQYTNLFQQAISMGLEARWPQICDTYAAVNQMCGDIVKVTPSSKVVGDLTLFMVTNDLTPEDILDGDRDLQFPQSVIDFLKGYLGTPEGGFPEKLQQRVLRGAEPLEGRPGDSLEPADFEATREEVERAIGRKVNDERLISYLLYPQVFKDFADHESRYGDVSNLPTHVFLYGPPIGTEVAVEIEPGKTLFIKLLAITEANEDGDCTVFFELNGQPRELKVPKRNLKQNIVKRAKAESGNDDQVGAPMPGLVVTISAEAGQTVQPGDSLLTLEAMKMETTIYADREGVVGEIFVKVGEQVDAKDLMLTYQS